MSNLYDQPTIQVRLVSPPIGVSILLWHKFVMLCFCSPFWFAFSFQLNTLHFGQYSTWRSFRKVEIWQTCCKYSIMEPNICNFMCDCSLIGPFVLLHSIHQWRSQVPWNGQKFEGCGTCFAVPLGYHFHSAYYMSNSTSLQNCELQATNNPKLRLGIQS